MTCDEAQVVLSARLDGEERDAARARAAEAHAAGCVACARFERHATLAREHLGATAAASAGVGRRTSPGPCWPGSAGRPQPTDPTRRGLRPPPRQRRRSPLPQPRSSSPPPSPPRSSCTRPPAGRAPGWRRPTCPSVWSPPSTTSAPWRPGSGSSSAVGTRPYPSAASQSTLPAPRRCRSRSTTGPTTPPAAGRPTTCASPWPRTVGR
ncbi:MAG: zf-HC2 domain-containing protein [Microthrixaceae bacterium]|nr:zf-HC2 domain-containing protein [Microthrixaceae bacterium]